MRELVPVDQVLDDMYSDTSGVSSAARDYYYIHYATEEQRQQMDREDRLVSISMYIAAATFAQTCLITGLLT